MDPALAFVISRRSSSGPTQETRSWPPKHRSAYYLPAFTDTPTVKST